MDVYYTIVRTMLRFCNASYEMTYLNKNKRYYLKLTVINKSNFTLKESL